MKNGRLFTPTVRKQRTETNIAEKVFDLQESTYWLTKKGSAFPHCIIIDLGKQYEIGGFRMLPRAEKGAPSVSGNYQVCVGNTVK